MSERAPAKEPDSRPERAGLVLASLIAVATVANLNLSVANVAMPEIGDDVRLVADDAQPHRGGVLVRPRRVGSLVRGARRSLRAQAAHRRRDDALRPGLASGRVRVARRRPLRRARGRRALRGHGLPDDPRADHRALVGTRPDQVDRSLVGLGGGFAALGPLVRGILLEYFDWGRSSSSRSRSALIALADGRVLRAQPRQRDHRAGRQPRRDRLRRARRRADPLDQLLAGERHGDDVRSCLLAIAAVARVAFFLRQRRARESALRPEGRGAGRRSGSLRAPGSSSSDRSWAPRSSASSTCRTSSATRRSRRAPRSSLRRSRWCWSLRARRSSCAAHGSRRSRCSSGYVVPLPRVRRDAAALEGGHSLLADRDPVRASSGSGSVSPGRPPRTR